VGGDTEEEQNAVLAEVGPYAWYGGLGIGNSGDTTHEVGQKLPNAIGAYDMSGNVYEWCWDWYAETYETSAPFTDADTRGPDQGAKRIVRGGNFESSDYYLGTSRRESFGSHLTSWGRGLRLVRGQ
jgi:formylglycine-generating enzyme required for sulfatase activity